MSSIIDNPDNSPQIAFLNKWHRGFDEMNPEVLAKYLHKDFRRYTYPRSLNQPVQTGEEWLDKFSGAMKFAVALKSTFHSVVEVPGKVIIHATNEVKNTHGLNSTRESVYTIYIASDDNGTLKIKQIDEFTDSKAYLELLKVIESMKGQE